MGLWAIFLGFRVSGYEFLLKLRTLTPSTSSVSCKTSPPPYPRTDQGHANERRRAFHDGVPRGFDFESENLFQGPEKFE